ncbi:MAG: hypothetical protein WC906_03540 [Parcubacteria group bacterium]|jgi:hypothetical protein
MKNSIKIIIGISMVIILSLITVFLIWQNFKYNFLTSETDLNNPNLITINSGTQVHFENLLVGLADIQNNTANLYFNSDGTNNSSLKKVIAGDKFEMNGYSVEVKSVEKAYNPSVLPGASHGKVKLIITKNNI